MFLSVLAWFLPEHDVFVEWNGLEDFSGWTVRLSSYGLWGLSTDFSNIRGVDRDEWLVWEGICCIWLLTGVKLDEDFDSIVFVTLSDSWFLIVWFNWAITLFWFIVMVVCLTSSLAVKYNFSWVVVNKFFILSFSFR